MAAQRSARAVLERTRARLPIRVKLALVSAILTFAILALFAVVVGAFAEQRLRSSYDADLRGTAADLQDDVRVKRSPVTGQVVPVFTKGLLKAAAAGGSEVHIVDRFGVPYDVPRTGAQFGPPFEGVRETGDYRVVARPLFEQSLVRGTNFDQLESRQPFGDPVAWVQYARPNRSLVTTIAKVRLFLLFGVLGGTALALLAGIAIGRRAMRPIADLTRAAREVAETRDPSRTTLPKPEANDEVTDLANTLEHMLGELTVARTETEAALERQRSFVADASHELRTPLTSILANLELLQDELERADGPRDREATIEMTESALRSSRRMRRLVANLLLLARADVGRRSQRQPLDLAAVVRHAAAEAGPLAAGHPLTIDLPREPLVVHGAADDLHRLVLNLIENAFIHTPSGTPVVASARASAAGVQLEIADRGPGVRPELRERVFERFAHSESPQAGAAGSGLGLAIVRAVAESHGGTVSVEDADGGGALFVVTLPRADPHRTPPERVPTTKPVSEPKGAQTP